MTDAPSRRAVSARARDAKTKPPTSVLHPATADELLQGWPLLGEPENDFAIWASERLLFVSPSPLPAAVRAALDEAQQHGTRENAVAVADALEAAADAIDRDLLDMGRLGALAERARISAALLGDADSCLLTAHLAGERAYTSEGDHLVRRYLVAQRVFNILAQFAFCADEHRVMGGADALTSSLLEEIRHRARLDVEIVSAVVGLFEDGRPIVDDVPDWFTHDDDEPAVTPQRGLIVLRSVDHLPGTAKAGDKPGSSSSPRGEWAPLAGVRLPLRPVPDLAIAKAALLDEFPDAGEVLDIVLRDLVGAPYARLRPTLLVGPAGSGKTRFARRLAEVLDLPVTLYGCAAVADGSFIGTSRQWSTGRVSVPGQGIKRAGVASVAVVLDEIEKAGSRRENGNLLEGLLPMLERECAQRYFDPYLECEMNLGAVTYIATANTLASLTTPLLDRFRVLHMPIPTAASLPALARGICASLRDEHGTDETWLPDLDGDELALIAKHWSGGSVRRLRRLIETIVSGRETFAPRH